MGSHNKISQKSRRTRIYIDDDILDLINSLVEQNEFDSQRDALRAVVEFYVQCIQGPRTASSSRVQKIDKIGSSVLELAISVEGLKKLDLEILRSNCKEATALIKRTNAIVNADKKEASRED